MLSERAPISCVVPIAILKEFRVLKYSTLELVGEGCNLSRQKYFNLHLIIFVSELWGWQGIIFTWELELNVYFWSLLKIGLFLILIYQRFCFQILRLNSLTFWFAGCLPGSCIEDSDEWRWTRTIFVDLAWKRCEKGMSCAICLLEYWFYSRRLCYYVFLSHSWK